MQGNLRLIVFALVNLVVFSSKGQSLFIDAGTNLHVAAGTELSLDSLVLLPTSGLTLTGANTFTRSQTVTNTTTNMYVKRVFKFTKNVTAFSGSVTVYYRDQELNGLAEDQLTLNVHDGTSWKAYNSSVTRNGNDNYVTTSGLGNITINEIALAGLSAALPMKWVEINAYTLDNGNSIDWTTTDEFNCKNFQVYRSRNSNNWEKIGSPIAANNTPGPNIYNYIDYSPYPNVTYYRVQANDIDGKSSSSKIVMVDRKTKPGKILIYPNPTRSNTTLFVWVPSGIKASIQIFNLKAQPVYTAEWKLVAGENRFNVPSASFKKGVYFVRVTTKNNVVLRTVLIRL